MIDSFGTVDRNGVAAALEKYRHGHSFEKVAARGIESWDDRMPEHFEFLLPLHLMESARMQEATNELKVLGAFDNEVGILQ